ncbi:MAG: DNA helicase II [Gammaproteobacteria bacterium]|nr:MAG: DNA helicase II [Gammaproteobacteria bacterium]
MDVSFIIDSLNDAQREAVTASQDPLLVLAGAGSGKTRVLVHRVAWLVQVEGISPYGILAVTFTNKAAGEMRTRIEQLIGVPTRGMWVGTFHGLAHRLLRAHWKEAGLSQSFQVLDSDDQYRVIRRILKALELDESCWPPRQSQWYINARKDEGQRPQHIEHKGDPYQRQQVAIYQAYEELCQRSGLVDFAELLLRAHELWLQHPELLKHYQQRFRHILVDEFQDTNTIQYAWLRVLSGAQANITIVGDDDQSIYGWRGAKIENLQRFGKDFPGARTLRLEQNYRSTGVILKAANALIARNDGRMGKKLWTEGNEGEPIQLYTAMNEQDEARFVVERIQTLIEQGEVRSAHAILYRSNAQSRVFEERLLLAGIAYRVYGGLRFFERQEIKDALAYLRLCENHENDASFDRAVNQPPRGIGERTLAVVRERAKLEKTPLWSAAQTLVAGDELSARARNALAAFIKIIQAFAGDIEPLSLGEQVEHITQSSGLKAHYAKEKGEKGQARIENLDELVNAAREFEYDAEEEEELEPLPAFLAHAALEAGEGQADKWEDCVQLMTLHSAKGLEFNTVFLCGLEEGLFPHQRSVEEPGRLEEERRLCYVGITRACKRLFITHAECRRLHGSESYNMPSRFIGEIPADLMEEIRPRIQVSRPIARQRSSASSRPLHDRQPIEPGPEGLGLGQRVQHATFGDGVILNYEGQGAHARVQVNFETAGSKWLVVAYANLQPA